MTCTPLKKNNSEDSGRILKHAGTITFFTFASRILGAARDLVIANYFGAGWVTDAFVQAFTIPNVLRRLTAEGSMTLSFLPLYTEIREKNDPHVAKKFAAKTLGMVLGVTTILTGMGMIFSPQLVFLFAAGFASSPEKFELTVLLTRIMFPYLIFVSLVAWSMGILNAEGHFSAPAAAPLFLNLSMIGGVILIAPMLKEPITAIGIGVLIGGIIQVLIQLPSLRKVGQSIKPSNFLDDNNIKRLLRLLGPSLIGVAVYQINIIVLRNLASFMPSGQVTHYYNASRLSELTLGVFAFAIATAGFPELSKHTADANWQKIRNTLRFTMATTLMLVIPASIGLVIAAGPIVSMLYFHGEYAWRDVQNTAQTLQAFAFSIPAVALVRLQTSVYFSLKDSATPVKISLVSILVTGVLGWWLSQSMEIFGLALGLAGGTWFQLLLLFLFLQRYPELRKNYLPIRSTLIFLIASGGMSIITWLLGKQGLWEQGPFLLQNWLVFIALLICSALIYLTLLMLLREEHAVRISMQLKSAIKKRASKK